MNIDPEALLQLDNHVLTMWKDTHGKIRGCNKKFTEILGFSCNEIVGRTDYDLSFTESEAKFFCHCDKRVMMTQVPHQFHEHGTFIVGQLEVLTFKSPIINHHGKTMGVAIMGYLKKISPLENRDRFLVHGQEITRSEMKILNLLIRGKTAKEIGERLYLSKRTVETYLDRVKDKFNVSTKSQLVDLVFDYVVSFQDVK